MESLIASILAVTGLVEICLLVYLISSPRHGRHRSLWQSLERLNIFLALFFVMTMGAFFFLNGPSYAQNLTFDLFGGGQDQVSDDPIFNLPTVTAADGSVSPNVTVLPKGTPMELIIPKTGVKTPIIFPTDTSTKGVLKALEGGVGVYPGSIMPGQRGHLILLGHSSIASWYRGDYGRVFALLNRLAPGDEFLIVAGDNKYTYKVSSNQVFKPKAADVYLAQAVPGSVVDLITCDPVGSAANRRIVSAQLMAGGQ